MQLKNCLFLLLAIQLLVGQFALVQAKPLVLMEEQKLLEIKHKYLAGELTKEQLKYLKKIIKRGDKALKVTPLTVTDKTLIPPSKNKKDYLSISRYWWPDPTKEDGLPWIRKDGVTNPDTQTDAVDRPRIDRMSKSVKSLALAYYFTGNEKYALKASELLDVWFLNEKTSMNPHLKYAQSVPGNPKSRRSGILDGRLIPQYILDSITLISSSSHWNEEQNVAMNQWLSQYLNWLTQSKVGKAGALQTNNHGSWYKFQVAALARYLNDTQRLENIVTATKESLAHQFEASGVQPHEVARTRSFFYSCFNLDALVSIGFIAEQAGLSFWNYETKNNRSIPLAIGYLLPVVEGQEWPYRKKGDMYSDLGALLIQVIPHYSDDSPYAAAFSKIQAHQDYEKFAKYIRKHLLIRRPELVLYL